MRAGSRSGEFTQGTSRFVVGLAFIVLALGCATAPARAPAEPPVLASAAPPAAPTKRDADETAAAFLSALQGRDFAAAGALMDGAMRKGLPEDQLAAVWDSQLARLGPLGSWKIVQRASANGKDVRVALLTFERGELQALLSVDPGTQALAGLFLKPVAKPAGPAAYVNPTAFQSVDVQVGAEPFLLQGVLTVPTGAGPFPAVVLVHGSGPNDRDATVGGNKPFKDLAEGLSSRGVAVLRYHKRTFQHGDRLTKSISLDDEVVLDAAAAVKLLKARPEVDARRVFVVGHSLGALLAPEIASRSAPVAGVVLLAPPARAPWDAVVDQLKYLEVPAEKLSEVEQVVAQLKANAPDAGALLGMPAAYWRDWAARDGVGIARSLRVPLLLLRGERDYQVTSEDLALWRKGLGGVPRVDIVELPALNHLLIPGTGKPGPAEYEVPGHVDVAVIERVGAFVTATPQR